MYSKNGFEKDIPAEASYGDICRAVVSNASQVLLFLSPDGEMIGGMRTSSLWRTAPREMIGAYSIKDDPNYIGFMPYLEKLFAGEEVFFPDYEYDPSAAGYSGPKRRLSTRGYPVLDESGAQSGILVVQHEDTTAGRRAEDLYESLFDEATWGIFRSTLDGRIITGNKALAAMLKYDSASAADLRNISELYVDEGTRERFIVELVDKGRIEGFEARLHRRDRSVMWTSISARITYDENGIAVVDGSMTDVTTVKEAEEQYRSLYENAFEGIFQLTPSGRFAGANPALIRIMGHASFSEMTQEITNVGRQCFADRRESVSIARALRARGHVQGVKVRWIRRDGRRIWVSLTARAVVDDAGRLSHYEGTLVDISGQVHSENVTNALYRISTAVNETRNLDDLYRLIHEELRTRINARNFFIGLLEKDEDRLVFPYFSDEKDEISEIQHISDPGVKSLSLEVLRTGRPVFVKKRDILKRLDGEAGVIGTMPEIWMGVPLRVKGDLIGVMAVQDYRDAEYFTGRDVALMVAISDQIALAVERRMDQESLRKSEEEYRSLFENAADGFFRADSSGRILMANPALANLIGLKSSDEISARGMNIVDLFVHPSDRFAFRQSLALKGKVSGMEVLMADGGKKSVWVSVGARNIAGAAGGDGGFDGVVTDIGERKKKEEAERARKAAEAASHAKSEFLAAMSHEIRTPMNAILGMADLLTGSGLTEQQAEYVQIFRTAGESLMAVLNDVLDLSKVEAGQVVLESIPFNLRKVVDETCRVMRTEAFEKGLSFSCRVSNNVPARLRGDPTRVRQVLTNLIGNALKFTHAGSVSVKVRRGLLRTGKEQIVFTVKDTGIGLEQENRERIFDSFSQADRSTTRKYGGTGLGLAISRRLVRLMNGEIRVDSEPGRGSSFIFTVLFDHADSPEIFGIPEKKGQERGINVSDVPSLNILVADDNAGNRALVRAYLEDTSCSVGEAADGLEALDMVRQGNFDMVFMDIEMPIMDGYEAIAAIREWERDRGRAPMSICALTAHAFETNRRLCFEAGCTMFLSKPIRMNRLLEAVVRAGECAECRPGLELQTPEIKELHHADAESPVPTSEPFGTGGSGGGDSEHVVVHVDPRIERLIPLFMETTEKDLEGMRSALLEGDLETVRRLGHSLKGAAANYGFDVMGGIGLDIETAALRGDGAEAAEHAARLGRVLKGLEIVIGEKK